MAYPTQLNNRYKSEKAEGMTTAKSYPEWYKEYQTKLNEVLATFHPEPETLEVETLLLTHQQLEEEIAALEQDLHEDTSEEIEQAIAATPLSKDQVNAIVATLAIQPTEVVVPVSKASKARLIYQEEEQAALVAKITLVRNKVIKRFMAELPLSAPGSATYYQNIRKSKGLIGS